MGSGLLPRSVNGQLCAVEEFDWDFTKKLVEFSQNYSILVHNKRKAKKPKKRSILLAQC